MSDFGPDFNSDFGPAGFSATPPSGSSLNTYMKDVYRFVRDPKSYVDRARQFSNPDLSKGQWEQAPDPTLMNKLALGGGPSQ